MLSCWIVNFPGIYHGVVRSIILLFDPDILQSPLYFFLAVTLYLSNVAMHHCHKIVELKLYYSGGCGIFLHVLPVLVNCEVVFSIDEWMTL